MGRNDQLMVLHDASGNRNALRKCHNLTLAYLSISTSGASRCSDNPK